ncbi:hypothetical protein Osc7112_6746 (plasmid) [Oscillatoria nigro-viridis PCC 7112]|uniref:Uncharacterized protein n=1 Tax=Phormidium nigroviride PCC 7112 TaxID=179408 RepID=K9VUF8_9CYAN|nr:hypothetical protein Osc7112_6746 [Oscillatoria nigro-viridis PCC 7112]
MQGDRALAGYRTNDSLAIIDISRLLRLQTGGQGAIALGVLRRYSTASTRIRRAMLGSIVKAAVLYTNRLAPGFNIDSRSRQAQFYQSPNSQEPNFRALAVESDRSLTSTPKNSYGTLAKTIKTINCSFLPPLLRLFDMACYATGALMRRIEEDSRGVGVQKITPKTTIIYKK